MFVLILSLVSPWLRYDTNNVETCKIRSAMNTNQLRSKKLNVLLKLLGDYDYDDDDDIIKIAISFQSIY
jgi:hypothetical protein